MDPNQSIINLVTDRFPGNDIHFHDGGEHFYLVHINYKLVGKLPKEIFEINVWDNILDDKIDRLVNRFMGQFARNGELHLHQNMCKPMTRERLSPNIDQTLLQNPINFNENMYIVMLEDIQNDGPNKNFPLMVLKLGIIQDHELPLFYPIRFDTIHGLTIIKKR